MSKTITKSVRMTNISLIKTNRLWAKETLDYDKKHFNTKSKEYIILSQSEVILTNQINI